MGTLYDCYIILLAFSIIDEALAALYVVEFCRELRFYNVIVEGDALQIVNAIKAGNKNWSKFEHIVDGIKERMHLL